MGPIRFNSPLFRNTRWADALTAAAERLAEAAQAAGREPSGASLVVTERLRHAAVSVTPPTIASQRARDALAAAYERMTAEPALFQQGQERTRSACHKSIYGRPRTPRPEGLARAAVQQTTPAHYGRDTSRPLRACPVLGPYPWRRHRLVLTRVPVTGSVHFSRGHRYRCSTLWTVEGFGSRW